MSDSPLPGRLVLNRYRVGSFIGRGAQGEVYHLEDLELSKRLLVLKIFCRNHSEEEHTSALINEIRYASGFTHPSLIRVFESGILLPEGKPYYVAEYFPGKPLFYFFGKKISTSRLLEFLLQLLSGLAYLHRSGLLHLDLKPSNLLLKKENFYRLKIIDFGTLTSQSLSTRFHFGSPSYMSPHLLCGSKPRPQDDLYSLGVILFQWLRGFLPYQEKDPEEWIGQIRLGNHPFAGENFVSCNGFEKIIHGLLFEKFSRVEEVQKKLDQDWRKFKIHAKGAKSVGWFCFPPPKFSKKVNDKIINALEPIFEPPGLKKTLIIQGPKGSGKKSLCKETIHIYAQKKAIPFLVLPGFPQYSALSAVRLLAEHSLQYRAFSGLDPISTLQSLTSMERRKHFLEIACRIVGDLLKTHGKFLLIFEDVSLHDFFLWQLIEVLNDFASKERLTLGIVITFNILKSEMSKSSSLIFQNCYLHRLLTLHVVDQIELKHWAPEKIEQFLIPLWGHSSRVLARAFIRDFPKERHTPGILREFLEEGYSDGRISQKNGAWCYEPKRRNRPRNKNRKTFLKIILPHLPPPIDSSSLKHIFQLDEDYRRDFVELVQDGYFLKDEDRFYWAGGVVPRLSYPGCEKILQHLCQKDTAYFLPLCRLFPTRKNAEKILLFLKDFEGTDCYFPLEGGLESLIQEMARRKKGNEILLSQLYFHWGRILNFTDSLGKATKALFTAFRLASTQDSHLRFLILDILCVVFSKKGQHEKVTKLLEGIDGEIRDEDEQNFFKALLVLSHALRRGPKSFPSLEFQDILQSLKRRDLSARLGLRYVQALLWAGKRDIALTWADQVIQELTETQQLIRLARALRMKAKILRDMGDFRAALELNEESLGLLKKLPFPKEELETLVALFYLQVRMGNFHSLEDYLCRIAKIMTKISDSQVDLLWPELVALSKEKTDPLEAVNYYEMKEKMARSYGSPFHLYVALVQKAQLQNHMGLREASRGTWRKAQKVFKKHGDKLPLSLQKRAAQQLELVS